MRLIRLYAARVCFRASACLAILGKRLSNKRANPFLTVGPYGSINRG